MTLKQKTIREQAENQFDDFITQLHLQQPQQWSWLMGHFEELIIPWLFKKVQTLPKDYNMSKEAFVEEVFANMTYKFFDLFKTGTFKSLADLRGLAFRIAELKLKEGYKKVKRDQKIYFSDSLSPSLEGSMLEMTVGERRRKEVLEEVKEHIYNLPKLDRQILIEYLKGESYKEIAETTGLTSANCRKKKQRALQKVKKMFFGALRLFVFYLSI